MNKVRVKIKARLFCKQLKHDMSCISLIRYFYGKGYRVVYFDKNSNGFKSITSYLRIRQRSDDLQSFTYRSEMSSYVFISKKLNYDAKRQSLLREAAHIELGHNVIDNIAGNTLPMFDDADNFSRYVAELHSPKY
jgi:hypothetical protein